MQRKVKVMAIAAVIALMTAVSVMAQTVYPDVGSLSSNTKAATAGIFTNDVDLFVNYHKYENVLKDGAEWFGFASGKPTAGGVADLGYARSFGGLYLGVWYRGNIAHIDSTHVDDGFGNERFYIKKTLTPTWDDTLGVLTKTVETTEYVTEKWLENANKFEFLIGVAGQGIKVGFYESYSVDQNPGAALLANALTVTDWQDGRKDYKNVALAYQNSQGYLRPYLGWGTNIGIGDMNLMPFVDLSFQIKEDTLVNNTRDYTEVNGVKQNVVDSVGSGHNNGVLTPSIAVGANLDLAKKNTTVAQLQLKYNLSLNLYNNDYSATGLSGSVPGTVTWTGHVDKVTPYANRTETETDINLQIEEQTNFANTITLGYKVTGEPFDNFKLGFLASVPVNFGTWSKNQYSKDIYKNTVKYNSGLPGSVTESESTNYSWAGEGSWFNLGLNLALGASYKLIPDRFTINAGIGATPLVYSHNDMKVPAKTISSISTSKTTQDDGTVTANTKTVTKITEADEVHASDTWDQWTATLSGGFTFNFGPKAALDLGISSIGGLGSSANTFELLIDYVNVIFTFKF